MEGILRKRPLPTSSFRPHSTPVAEWRPNGTLSHRYKSPPYRMPLNRAADLLRGTSQARTCPHGSTTAASMSHSALIPAAHAAHTCGSHSLHHSAPCTPSCIEPSRVTGTGANPIPAMQVHLPMQTPCRPICPCKPHAAMRH